MRSNSRDLVKRIAKLLRQNQELNDHNLKLTRENDKLKDDVEHLEKLVASLPTKEVEVARHTVFQPEERYKMATVLFAGLHGASMISSDVSESSVMDDLDNLFHYFDDIVARYKVLKIKSIGDTFVCCGGIPDKNSTNPVEVILAAIEMQDYFRTAQIGSEPGKWNIRIGIHTGNVHSVDTSKKKSGIDIKGDTLNIASRIEDWSEEGRITISANTYELVKEFFACEYYGKMPVRYKGNLQMFVVKGILPELSEQGSDNKRPNQGFFTKLALLRFGDIQEFMLDKLEKELPEHLYYHNVKHTVDVVTQVELIGIGEGISEEEILLLKTAALFHDAGHIINYDEHEYHSALLARKYLPNYHYSPIQIERICELIKVTKLPPVPKNKLEEIMCDSDLDYLGRSDMIPVSGNLYKELKKQNKVDSLNEWNKRQLSFISNHQYFTGTALNLREVNKQKQIERLRSIII